MRILLIGILCLSGCAKPQYIMLPDHQTQHLERVERRLNWNRVYEIEREWRKEMRRSLTEGLKKGER